MRILVVEDDLQLNKALKAILEGFGHQVTACHDGREALWALDRAARHGAYFDLVLSDHYMEGVEGIALLHEIRRMSPEARCVLMTGSGRPELRRHCSSSGFTYLEKPFDHGALHAAVHAAAV